MHPANTQPYVQLEQLLHSTLLGAHLSVSGPANKLGVFPRGSPFSLGVCLNSRPDRLKEASHPFSGAATNDVRPAVESLPWAPGPSASNGSIHRMVSAKDTPSDPVHYRGSPTHLHRESIL